MPNEEDGIETLTPGHFLIGGPLQALPDSSFSYKPMYLLRRWHLCQSLVCHFWSRRSLEYVTSLRRYIKWHKPSRNLKIGDLVVLQDDGRAPMKWPLFRVIEVNLGIDGIVRVATVKTCTGAYKRPIVKLAFILPSES